MTEPFVSLVGAGPGDPELITVKGLRRLAEADVVLYDALVDVRLLEDVKPGAELICVGKRGWGDHVPQSEIDALMLAKAREGGGKRVVRLKGGDPFVFGRGGEEAALLAANGVAYEVVPGVTAALGAAAYAGIPLTKRGEAAAVTFVTGHEDPTKDVAGVDWAHLAQAGGTLCVYMGMKSLPSIVDAVTAAGVPADTPVAIVMHATTDRQREVRGTLGDIAWRAAEAGVSAPALIFIGKVVGDG